MRIAIGFSIAASSIFLSACQALGGNVKKNTIDDAGVTVLSYNAETRGAFFRHTGKDVEFCAEPSPDVALNRSVEAAGKISAQTQGVTAAAEANAEVASQVVRLAGRNSTVVLARELLYRTCEQAAAGNLSNSDVKDNFNSVVDLIRDLGEADKISAASEAGVSPERIQNLINLRRSSFDELLDAILGAKDDATVMAAMTKAADALFGNGNPLTAACDTKVNCIQFLRNNETAVDRDVAELTSQFKAGL